LDGVYVEDEHGELGFHALGTPSSVEVRDIARRTAHRLHRAFDKQGRPSPWEEHAFVDSGEADPFSLEEPGLFASATRRQPAESPSPVSRQGSRCCACSPQAPRSPSARVTLEPTPHPSPRPRAARPLGAALLRHTASVVQHDQILWSAQQSLTPPRSRGAEACRPSALRAARRGR
jgi:hypothetical protein